MPFIIRGPVFNTEVTVGHRYNDTAKTQCEVTATRLPSPSNFLKGMLKLKEMDAGGDEKWYYPHVIFAEWVDVP